jgi:hypothetical protein
MLDNGLRWQFVSSNSKSSAQILALFPAILQTGLNLENDQVIAAGLQVYKPSDYTGPSDIKKLLTIVLCYIPTASVNDLASMIGVKNSRLYNTNLPAVYTELASHIVGSYPITSGGLSGDVSGSSNGGDGDSPASASGASHTRQDAIIGVVTALGAITLIVLVLLIFRALKRRQELAHRRMSDPPAGGYAGVRPQGQEFDRDSIGGQRRRSFYFAADSLAGADSERSAMQQHGQQYEQQQEAIPNPFSDPRPVMRQRVAGGQAISTPILRDNTMNW